MWPDQVSNPGPLTYESGALPTAQRGPVNFKYTINNHATLAGDISSLNLLAIFDVSSLRILQFKKKNIAKL